MIRLFNFSGMKNARYWACALVMALGVWPLASVRAAPRCYPTLRFVPLSGEGTVRDTLTKLVWQQQTSSDKLSWGDANNYCLSLGFRLPTAKELSSLLDLTVVTGPTINQVAFSSTQSEEFWTSSPNANAAGEMWCVDFSSGGSSSTGAGSPLRVRCVR